MREERSEHETLDNSENRVPMESEINDESMAKIAFLRLDPILRMLLASIEKYREFTNTDTTLNRNALMSHATASDEERILRLLRTQVKLLETLRFAWKDFSRQSLLLLSDYILLPLTLLLQCSNWSIKMDQLSIRQQVIRDSVHRTSTQAAAETLTAYVLLLSTDCSLSPEQTVRCLVSCAMALPMDNRVSQNSEPRLDRGEDHVQVIFQSIETLVTSANHPLLSDQVATALDGALVARIVHCGISVVTPKEGTTISNPELLYQALQTLRAMMKVVPKVSIWRALFPGCFAGLYRLVLSQLRHSPAQASPKVSSTGLQTLAQLMTLTLQSSTNTNPTNTVLQQIQSLRNLSDVEPKESKRELDDPTGDLAETDFWKEVHSRLPAPLMVLIQLLPTATSPTLRLAAPSLCRSILGDTRHVWTIESSLLISALECCLILTRDTDVRVASSARTMLSGYQEQLGMVAWRDHVASVVSPRVLELMKEIPALSKSRRETELRARLNLISGYLELTSGFEKKANTTLGASLVTGEVADEIRKILIGLFDMDFDSIQYFPAVTTVATIALSMTGSIWHPDGCRFCYMSDETILCARHMVQSLGKALGEKKSAIVVDACLADLFQACVTWSESRHPLFGTQHLNWLHNWVGSGIVAHEITIGAFGDKASEVADATSLKDTRHNRHKRRLGSLACATFPVIVSSPLWTLPTVADDVATSLANRKDVLECRSGTPIHGGRPVVGDENGSISCHTVSASALKGNAMLVCSLINLVGKIVDLLGFEAESLLSVILYPLCEKTSAKNHSHVQHTAMFVLHRVAAACGMSSTKDLVRQNFDYLFGTMQSRLRTPGVLLDASGNFQTDYPISLPCIALAVLRHASGDANAAGVGNRLKKPQVPAERSTIDESAIPYVLEFMKSLVSRFDRALANISGEKLHYATASFDLVQLLDATVCYLAFSFGLNLNSLILQDSAASAIYNDEPWLDLLEPFRTHASGSRDGPLSVKQGVQSLREPREPQPTFDTSASGIAVTQSELNFLSLALGRCGFFLSLPSLEVQVASCTAMAHTFQLLGCITTFYKMTTDEVNGPNTSVLREISDTWPSIVSRLRSMTLEVMDSRKTSTISLRSLHVRPVANSENIPSTMAHLSNLYNLIACMCEVSEDFMITRFRDDVWPNMAKVLDGYLDEWPRTFAVSNDGETKALSELTKHRGYTTAREKLLHSILDCLSRVFGKKSCGLGLSGLVSPIGSVLLPFLSDKGMIGEKAMDAMKNMLLIDCDSLWRALATLGNRAMRTRPPAEKHGQVVATQTNIGETIVETRANELLDFSHSLAEPVLAIL